MRGEVASVLDALEVMRSLQKKMAKPVPGNHADCKIWENWTKEERASSPPDWAADQLSKRSPSSE
jgi:hypothetical protein